MAYISKSERGKSASRWQSCRFPLEYASFDFCLHHRCQEIGYAKCERDFCRNFYLYIVHPFGKLPLRKMGYFDFSSRSTPSWIILPVQSAFQNKKNLSNSKSKFVMAGDLESRKIWIFIRFFLVSFRIFFVFLSQRVARLSPDHRWLRIIRERNVFLFPEGMGDFLRVFGVTIY